MKMFKLVIQLIEALAWPGVTLYVIISFRVPLKNLLERLAKKLGESSKSKISVGSLSIELENRLQKLGEQNLAVAVRSLPRSAFDLILRLGDTNHHYGFGSNANDSYYLPSHKMMANIHELHRAKLLAFPEPLEEFLHFVRTRPLFKYVPDPSGQDALGHAILPKEGLSESERKRVEHMSFRLNEEGKHVHDTLLDILLAQFTENSKED